MFSPANFASITNEEKRKIAFKEFNNLGKKINSHLTKSELLNILDRKVYIIKKKKKN